MKKAKIDPKSESDFLDVLSGLISIPSVKSEPTATAPYGASTAEVLRYILSLARDCGLRIKNLDDRVGYIEWGAGEKMIAVLCHLDVVPPGKGWETDPFSLARKDGKLIGRGVTDNKGPAVCSFFALLRLKESGYEPPCRIRIIFGLDEEHGCTCMEHYVAVEELPDVGFTPDADFPAIFAEKGLLQIRLSGEGSSAFEASGGDAYNMVPSSCTITSVSTGISDSTVGVPAHASTPEKGDNAILKAVSNLSDPAARKEPVFAFIDKYLTGTENVAKLITCAPGDISGDLTINTGIIRLNANESTIGIDIRYPVKSKGEDVFRQVSEKASAFGLRAQIVSHLLPLYTDPDSPSMLALRKAYETHVQSVYLSEHPDSTSIPGELLRSSPIAIGGGTYARSMPGIVAFGPVFPWQESTMHQKNEFYSENAMLASVDLYRDAIIRLCETVEE
ncbi:MAG: Sapep family Mn(2+)-dependent dipeptidase [Clostridiales bacterium]|nr:Sapep family Mn(2+)-dependent dipeptidase [Clostridiales bacterium]